MLQRAARNAYSWWWASHIRTKQSKWLDQNLQDMEEKVEYILKIINEDGDSFAVRAEMYYRKRPELVNFVEDCFRGYRALAERYDHLSRDLQSANRTIAAVYPERVQLSMDEDEEFSFPAQETNLGNFPTSLPDVPKVNLPKSPNLPKKKSKMPSRLMSKKGLVKIGGEDEKVVNKSSGLSKTEALEEIDKLQKGILTLQTEKEFVKSSYENGLARFWEIENRVTEMQAKVSNLQDEFGIGTVIEDDEARILMATAALKSCQETLAKLQEKRVRINKEAKTEYLRIYEAHEKFESIKEGNMSGPTKKQEILEENEYLKHLHEEAESVEQEMAKVEEQVLLGGEPVTISELAEKIDELVDKVIGLETEVTSQTSLVKRMRSETDELWSHMKSLEEDEEMLIDGSDGKSDKIRRLGEELRRVESLNQNVQVQNQSLQTHFLIASSSVDQLSENLVNVKPDEDVESSGLFEEAGAGTGEILFQHLTAANKKKDETEENYGRSKQKGFFDVVVEIGQLKAASKNNTELGFKGNPEITSPGSNSKTMITKDGQEKGFSEMTSTNVVKFSDQRAIKAREGESLIQSIPLNNLGKADEDKPYQSTQHEDFSKKGEDKYVSEDKPEKGFSEPEEGTALYNSLILEGRMEADAKMDNVLRKGLEKDASQDKRDGFSASFDIAAPDNGLVISNHGQSSSTNTGTEDWYVSHLSNPFNDHYEIMGSWNNSIITDEKDYHVPDSAPRIVQLGGQLDHSSEKSQQLKERNGAHSPEALKQVDKDTEEIDTDEEDQPNWRHLFMYGLEYREKMLLEEYTSTLRNYKQVKKKLSEVEKKNRASLFKTTVQIKVLRSSNASKDAEIQSLHQKLNLFQTNIDETPDLSSLEKEEESEIKKEEEEEEDGEIKQEDKKEEVEIKKIPIDEAPIASSIEEKIPLDEAPIVSSIEEKIRLDIDDMLEEKIDFWLRFSITLHQIQKFQTAFHDLLTELKGVNEKKKQDGSATKQDQSEIRPIYKHLRDILTELTLWWENTKVLKEDLELRLSTLLNIQDEITRLSNGGEREEGSELSDYQAAKFQGEVMNMQQENKKVADELRVGADRVKRLQIDIEKTLAKLDEELGKSQQTKSSSSRSRIPLRSFLFGVKLRKQKPFFACMSPALQKQNSDLSALPK